MTSKLPPLQHHFFGPTMWVDEDIWGHRFHDEQTPWLVMLEFLALFKDRKDMALHEDQEEGKHESIRYKMPKHTELRSLLFKNPHIGRINSSGNGNDRRWRTWIAEMGGTGGEYDYLNRRFAGFSDFARVVEFFQNTSIEPHRQRRWSSRFIYPYGPDCVYADVKAKGSTLLGSPDLGSSDRLFFARGGELLYLMLNRSHCSGRIRELVRTKLLDSDNTWNRLAKMLVPRDADTEYVTQDVGYLPHRHLPEYDSMASDWVRLLELSLPGAVVLDPLVRITGLHMVLYHLRRSLQVFGPENAHGHPNMVLEIAAPHRTALVALSQSSYAENAKSSRKAVLSYIDRYALSSQWGPDTTSKTILTQLKSRFRWTTKENRMGDVFGTFREAVLRRHNGHIAGVVPTLSRNIGLSGARKGVGTWYRPDDAFLRSLLLATVTGKDDYREFLAKLYTRYGIVIGVQEAEQAFGHVPVDEKFFADNALRLEHRLQASGLLRRLSDDCAYVINPFGGLIDE